jgi:RES domain-containing protein
VTLWRISNHITLTGDGGLRASARWHTRGRRIVYCAMHPAAALLEALAHLELALDDLPAAYRLLKIDAPGNLAVTKVSLDDLPRDWIVRTNATREIGDRWLEAAQTPLLSVPSALVPETFNMLLNPEHEHAGRITVVSTSRHVIDPRLL